MPDSRDPVAGSDALRALPLEMGLRRSPDRIAALVVERLAARGGVALARIWLRRAGDICPDCPMLERCPDQRECLHLVAGAGAPRQEGEAAWDRVDGEHRRYPLGVGKVGRVGATGEPLEIVDVADVVDGLSRPDWGRREGIRGLAAEPLVRGDEIVGVLLVLGRTPLAPDGVERLRLVAAHAGAALAAARERVALEESVAALDRRVGLLAAALAAARGHGEIVGACPEMVNVLRKIEMVAPTDSDLLIVGEPGSGKTLVAAEIARRSRRGPLIECDGSGAEVEAELFGGEDRRPGCIELADGGTLLLRRLDELPGPLQERLYRTLDSERITTPGPHPRPVDVRWIATASRDLRADVEAGRFHRDLYYALSVFSIELPPLRARAGDIPLLAEAFCERWSGELGRPRPRLDATVLAELAAHDWPGNVRELRSLMEGLVLNGGTAPPALAGDAAAAPEVVSEEEMRRRERANLVAALEATGGRIYGEGGAAELLGMKPTTLSSRLKKMRIDRTLFEEG